MTISEEIKKNLVNKAIERGNYNQSIGYNIINDEVLLWYNDRTGSTHIVKEKD